MLLRSLCFAVALLIAISIASTGGNATVIEAQGAPAASLPFQQLEPGLDYATGVFNAATGRVGIAAARVNLRNHRIGLAVPARGENGRTLSEFQRLTGAKLTLSGGFMASFLPPIPLGLVKRNGVLINRAAGGDLLTGVIAIRSGRPSIRPWNGFKADRRDGCLQSGPLLLENGHIALATPSELQPSARTLIERPFARAALVQALSDVIAMLVTEPVALAALVNFVTREFGPGAAAVNLSGANSAGLVVAVGTARQTAGHDTLLLANAVVVDATR
jgi:hypothetical protein